MKPVFRRREVVLLTGLARGLFQGWEQRGLWKWSGPKGQHRFYSFADLLSFVLVNELTRIGITASRAWEAVRDNLAHILEGGVNFIMAWYEQVAGHEVFAYEVATHQQHLTQWISGTHIPNIRCLVMLNVRQIQNQLGDRVAVHGREQAVRSDEELLARLAEDEAEQIRDA